MDIPRAFVIMSTAIVLAGCASAALDERDRFLDPQSWKPNPGVEQERPLQSAIDHCYATYLKGGNYLQKDRLFASFRRCMDTNGYLEVFAD